MNDKHLIDDILERWETLRRAGEHPNVELLCRDHPELLMTVRDRIRDLELFDQFADSSSLRVEPSLVRPGMRIGAYLVIDELARGGMGIVYRCRQDNPSRDVAVKVMHPGRANADSLRRFEMESRMLGMLAHKGIARILEAGTADLGAGLQDQLPVGTPR